MEIMLLASLTLFVAIVVAGVAVLVVLLLLRRSRSQTGRRRDDLTDRQASLDEENQRMHEERHRSKKAGG